MATEPWRRSCFILDHPEHLQKCWKKSSVDLMQSPFFKWLDQFPPCLFHTGWGSLVQRNAACKGSAEEIFVGWYRIALGKAQNTIIRRGPVGKSRGLFLGLNWIAQIMPTRRFLLWQRTPWTWALLLSSVLQCLQWIGFVWMKHFPYGKLLWCL